VHVQLLLANSVGDSPVDLYDLRSEDVAIEDVRPLEIADRDDNVVQAHASHDTSEWRNRHWE
jgi:hypothetical protein